MQNTCHRFLPYNCVVNQANCLLELWPKQESKYYLIHKISVALFNYLEDIQQ